MAKTFGTGADPKGLVARGVEGSGAAQIFRPSQAVQDFVTGQRQQGLQKQKQKQAEAKAKAERNKSLDKAFDDALKIDLKGWTEPDNQMILGEYKNILTEAAKLKAQGLNPNDDLDFSTKVAQLKLNVNALQDQKKLWELANTKAYTMAQNKQLDEEAFNNYATNITAWQQLPFAERNANIALLEPPKIQEQIDWFKGLEDFTLKTKQNLFIEEIEDVTITEKFTPQQRINTRFETFKKTPAYKAAIEAGETDDSLKKFIAQSLPYEYRKQLDEEKGGIDIDFGNGTIVSGGIKAIYAPDAYKTVKTIIPKAAGMGAENVPVGNDGAIIFNPKPKKTGEAQEIPFQLVAMKNSDPIKFRANALFKAPNGQFVMVGEEEVIVPQVTQSGTTQYTKTVQPLRITVSEQNKEEFENRYLGGMPMEEAFENFKSQRKATQPTPQSTTTKPATTTNKFDKYKRK